MGSMAGSRPPLRLPRGLWYDCGWKRLHRGRGSTSSSGCLGRGGGTCVGAPGVLHCASGVEPSGRLPALPRQRHADGASAQGAHHVLSGPEAPLAPSQHPVTLKEAYA